MVLSCKASYEAVSYQESKSANICKNHRFFLVALCLPMPIGKPGLLDTRNRIYRFISFEGMFFEKNILFFSWRNFIFKIWNQFFLKILKISIFFENIICRKKNLRKLNLKNQIFAKIFICLRKISKKFIFFEKSQKLPKFFDFKFSK